MICPKCGRHLKYERGKSIGGHAWQSVVRRAYCEQCHLDVRQKGSRIEVWRPGYVFVGAVRGGKILKRSNERGQFEF